MSASIFTPLADDEIRLFELQSSDVWDSYLEGKLDKYRLEVEDPGISPSRPISLVRDGTLPPIAEGYDALSYTWGDEEPRKPIKIYRDNKSCPFDIKSNLEAALRRFRASIPRGKTQLFWIDALCINQGDLVEKSGQIRKMAEIYNQARLVRVWLGNEAEDSDIAIRFIGRLLDLDVFDQLTRDPVSDTAWAALRNLMRRPWFNRRWIVQEIGLARNARVYCGSNSVAWEDFAEAVSLFTKADLPLNKIFQRSERFQHHPDFLGEMDALGAKSLVDVADNLFRKSDEGTVLEHLRSLEALMSTLTVFESSDPRDTVYAILWLAHDARPGAKNLAALNDTRVSQTPVGSPVVGPKTPLDESDMPLFLPNGPGLPPMDGAPVLQVPPTLFLHDRRSPFAQGGSLGVPETGRTGKVRSANDLSLKTAERIFEAEPKPILVDYSLPLYDVYKQFLEFVIRGSKSLDIICLPWAPPPREPKPGSDAIPEGPLPSWIPPISGKAFDLRPIEKVYSRVAADSLVGTPGMGPRNYNACGKTRAHWGQPDLITERTLHVRGFVVEAIDQIEPSAVFGIIPYSWLKLAEWEGEDEDPLPEDFWRTLVADRGSDGHKPPPHYFRGACKWTFNRKIKNRGINTRDLLTHGNCNPIAREFLRRVQAVTWERRLILSEASSGRQPLLGLVPSHAKKGDLICILYGCSVPVILRKKDNEPSSSKRKRGAHGAVQRRTASKTAKNSTPRSGQSSKAAGRLQNAAAANRPGSRGSTTGSTSTVEAETNGATFKIEAEVVNGAGGISVPGINIPDEYTFIGECYIHGMMSGEGFKYQTETGNRVQEFRLV